MKAIVISHGEIKNYEFIKEIVSKGDMVVCADGGAEYAYKCGIIPDVLIGDLDSIDKDILENIRNTDCKVIKYPREKDYTDTQLAVDYAIEHGVREIIFLGSIGDRLDHSLANIFLLVKLLKQNISGQIINEKNIIYITNNYIKLNGSIGDTLSLIPVGGDVEGIYTEGLQYKLSGQGIPMGEPLGISNVFIKCEAEIRVKSGFLLVIKAKD